MPSIPPSGLRLMVQGPYAIGGNGVEIGSG